MLVLVAALIAVAQPAPPAKTISLGQTAWIFSTIDHSEFCPAGNVRLNLQNGQYEHVAGAPRRACEQPNLERPVKNGRLRTDQLAAIRAAYLRVLGEGFESQACRDGKHPEEIIISNGGTPILVLTTGSFSAVAPEDLSCWTDAASALHHLMDKTFSSPRQR